MGKKSKSEIPALTATLTACVAAEAEALVTVHNARTTPGGAPLTDRIRELTTIAEHLKAEDNSRLASCQLAAALDADERASGDPDALASDPAHVRDGLASIVADLARLEEERRAAWANAAVLASAAKAAEGRVRERRQAAGLPYSAPLPSKVDFSGACMPAETITVLEAHIARGPTLTKSNAVRIAHAEQERDRLAIILAEQEQERLEREEEARLYVAARATARAEVIAAREQERAAWQAKVQAESDERAALAAKGRELALGATASAPPPRTEWIDLS